MKIYAIHEGNLDRLQKKLTRIRNKCMKYGCDFHYAEVGEEFRVVDEGTEDEHMERYVLVECEGTAVVNGWKFAATLEHTSHGNIVRSAIDIQVPNRYRDCGPECEHCKSSRHRKDTYLVFNEETGEFKQVGSSCVCDFTGGLNAEVVASYLSLLTTIEEYESRPVGSSYTPYYDVREILRYAVDYVDHVGYHSSYGEGESTKEMVVDAMRYDRGKGGEATRRAIQRYRDRFNPDYNSEELAKRVETIIEYFKSLDPNDDESSSDYMRNLITLAHSDCIQYRNIGYVVSMVVTYNKIQDRIQERKVREAETSRERTVSKHMGQVGDKVVLNHPEVKLITSWENQYGYTFRYKLTVDGNVYMWDSSNGIDTEHEVEFIKATVKKLDEFNGVKQTWITRGRVTYGPEKLRESKPETTGAQDALDEAYKLFTEDV